MKSRSERQDFRITISIKVSVSYSPSGLFKDLFTGVQHSGHNYTPIYLWNGPKIYNLNQNPGAREGQQEAAEGASVHARGGRTGWRCRCDLAFEPDASANLMNIGFGLVC